MNTSSASSSGCSHGDRFDEHFKKCRNREGHVKVCVLLPRGLSLSYVTKQTNLELNFKAPALAQIGAFKQLCCLATCCTLFMCDECYNTIRKVFLIYQRFESKALSKGKKQFGPALYGSLFMN